MPVFASTYADASLFNSASATARPTLVNGPGPETPVGAPLVFTFSEPIRLGNGTLTISGPSGPIYSGDIGATPGLTVSGSTLVYSGYAPLAYSAIHTFAFGAGSVLDQQGNALNGGESIDYAFLSSMSPLAVNATGTPGGDRLMGSDQADSLDGADGPDTLYGFGGSDILYGGAGDDMLEGGMGNDVLDGGAGDDWLEGDLGDDKLYGGIGNDRLAGGSGIDDLRGGAGNDRLYDVEGDTVMYGDDGNDDLSVNAGVRLGDTSGSHRLYGGKGDDIIGLSAGTGLLDGGEGNDTLFVAVHPGSGAGLIEALGRLGNDHFNVTAFRPDIAVELTGGAGRDLFTINEAADGRRVTVLDFQTGAGGDVLDIPGMVPDTVLTPFDSGYVRFQQRGADTVFQADFDGAGTAFGFQDQVTLRNVASNMLTAENIRYGHMPGDTVVPGQRVDGTDGADRIEAGAGADRVAGGAGNDVLVGGSGNDVLDGGAGLDTVRYSGARADYEVRASAFESRVDDKRGGVQDGRDLLTGVERMMFSDGAVAIDIGNAGVAAQTYRLYRAAFDRTPDEGGLGFWMARVDAGTDLLTVANEFVRSAEFNDLYGAASGNAAILRELYLNVFDREPDSGGFAFWLDVLDSRRASVAEVLLEFSDSNENIAATVMLIAEGIPYQPYLG